LTYSLKIAQKIKNPFSSWSFFIFLIYGIFLLWFLFLTVHDRTEAEFAKRIDYRWAQILEVWINHGYLKHGGMAFMAPADLEPKQIIFSSNTQFYMQLAHILQRFHINNENEFGYALMAVHNQIIPMLGACFLGFLAMRLIMKTGMAYKSAVILGLSAQTVYQTFPLSLGYVWGIGGHPAFVILMLGFLILEEGGVCSKNRFRKNIVCGLLVFLMTINSLDFLVFFFIPYYFVKLITCNGSIHFGKKMLINIFSFLSALSVIVAQILWVKSEYPQVTFWRSDILIRSGFDGDLAYYYDHMDLLSNRYLLNLPGWHILLLLGSLAILAVIILVQRKCVALNQQTTLLSMVGVYILFGFLLSQSTVIHVYNIDLFLVVPVILALFALLPAWLEKTFIQFKHKFVALSVVLAFGTAGLQMLAYWIHMPPLFFV
jgi:hypothetical protein